MSLIEHYAALRQVHLVAVTASLALFAARGLAVWLGHRWPLGKPARQASWAIDAVLLAAGASLWGALGLNPTGPDHWLGVKLALLVVYVGLGTFALRRARTRATRLGFYLAALACAATMVGIARAHHPLGGLSGWL